MHSSVHDLSDEFLIVHVALGILLILEQLLDLIVGQFLAQRCQQMPQFGGGNETAGIFIEVTQSLDEIVGRVARSCFRNRMIDGKEDFKRNAFVRFQLMCALFDILLGGILTQSTKAFTHLQSNFFQKKKKLITTLIEYVIGFRIYLVQLDLAITSVIEKIECLLELCAKRREKPWISR